MEKITQNEFDQLLIQKGRPYLRGQGPLEGIMFVGTNPSVRSKLGNLWEDPYGLYFGSFLREAGIDPYSVYVTNIYKHPTPDNRPLLPGEIEEGWRELLLEIGFVDPNIIVALGNQVQSKFDIRHGELKNWKAYRVYGLHHPSYVNRSPNEKVDFINNLIRIKQLYEQRKKVLQNTVG